MELHFKSRSSDQCAYVLEGFTVVRHVIVKVGWAAGRIESLPLHPMVSTGEHGEDEEYDEDDEDCRRLVSS